MQARYFQKKEALYNLGINLIDIAILTVSNSLIIYRNLYFIPPFTYRCELLTEAIPRG